MTETISIVEVKAYKDEFVSTADRRVWTGWVKDSGISFRSRLYQSDQPSKSKIIKRYLKERYPESKKHLRVYRCKSYSTFYDFYIEFTNDAEEAEFIMTFKNLEGETL
jgi:hypothetical protein